MMIERRLRVGGFLDGAGDDFADHRAHAAANEGVFHGADNHGAAVEFAVRVDDGVVEAGVVLRLLEARGVGLEVDELQRVGGDEVGVEDFVLVVVEKLGQAGARVDAEVLVALGADVEVVLEIFFPDDLAAARHT